MCEKEATTSTVGVVDMYFRVFPGFSFAPLINGYPQSSGSQIRLVFSPQSVVLPNQSAAVSLAPCHKSGELPWQRG